MDGFSSGKPVLFSAFLFLSLSLFAASNAQTQNCSTYAFSNGRRFANCNTLPVLSSFLHWNYHRNNHTVDIAYRHTQITSSNWVAWALNPSATGMIGAQSLVAFVPSSGGAVRAHTAPITNYSPSLADAPLSFAVPSISAELVGNNQIIIYATIELPAGSTRFAHVWQHGNVSGGNPGAHLTSGEHVRSTGTIDFASTNTSSSPPAPPTEAEPEDSPPPTPTTDVTRPSQNCPAYSFSNGRTYTECDSLPVLGAFLHWNYQASNNSIDIAYRHTGVSRSSWVAWALNPTGSNMIGAQSLVAVVGSSGSVRAYTSPVTSYQTTLQEGPLSFGVPSISAEFVDGNQVIIYATIQLPPGSGVTNTFTQVWQHGPTAGSGDTPQQHSTSGDNVRSIGSINFATGATTAAGGGSRQRNRNVHGVLNVVSWGILMPLGGFAARYLKVFKSANPAWFYLHVTCQTSAYIVGVAGWGTGMKLGSDSTGVQQTAHRIMGIVLFALGTLQVFALLLRPKPDHKFRFYWNIYHHLIGYTVLVLAIVNIFEGFEILDPVKKWKNAYIGVLIFLGASLVLLEALTWCIVLKRKNKQPAAATNGYHA